MKKSQVLAALALAFALGVVAPVASVVNTASVSAYNTEADTATYADTTNAIAFVENDATYKAYVQIQDAIKAYNTGVSNGTIADFTNTDGQADVVDAATNIYTAVNTAQTADGRFGYNITKYGTDITSKANFIEQINAAISGAQTSELYNKLSAVAALVDNNVDNATNNGKLVSAVTALRTYAFNNNIITQEQFDNLHPEEATINKYKVSNPVATLFDVDYTNSQTIMNAIDDAQEAVAKYKKGYDLFMPLLVDSGILNQAAKDAINNAVNVKLGDLLNYATNSIVRNTELSALYTAVQNVKANRVSEESGDNYSLIRNLAAAWKAATGNEQKVEDVMARMVAYTAPTGTGDGSNNNDGTGNDQNKAPNTGALTNAEGSASTTVAMVAGIATALTAAGAGVVAYRNARRSTRK